MTGHPTRLVFTFAGRTTDEAQGQHFILVNFSTDAEEKRVKKGDLKFSARSAPQRQATWAPGAIPEAARQRAESVLVQCPSRINQKH